MKISMEKGIKFKTFSSDALLYLNNLEILKNILQLKKLVEWILVMISDNNKTDISKNDLHKLGINKIDSSKIYFKNSMNQKIKNARDDFERNYLIYNLKKFEYNVSKMASEIGMERTALYRKLKLLKINMDI